MQNLSNAKSDLQIIKLGSSGGSTITNTNVKNCFRNNAEIPVEEGDRMALFKLIHLMQEP